MESLLPRPILFAHRGGAAHAPENSLEAFVLARKLGATGIESDAWVTSDGVAVLSHGGLVRTRRLGRPRPVRALAHAEVAGLLPTVEEALDACGPDMEFSLDIKDPAAAPAVVAAARSAGALARTWLCHGDHEVVAGWRSLSDEVRLVDSTRLRKMREGPERRAATLADAGIDAVNLHATDWSGGLTTLFHRFDRLTLGWDAQFERVLLALFAMGIDGVYSDHVDRMTDALALHLR